MSQVDLSSLVSLESLGMRVDFEAFNDDRAYNIQTDKTHEIASNEGEGDLTRSRVR